MIWKCPKCGIELEGNLVFPIRCCEVFDSPDKTWPRWAERIGAWRKPGELGVGDTFHRLATSIGADRVSRLIAWFGIECGCEGRRQQWNELYPYA